eukprot:CAMPEP_0184677088 /NCGR_PEP_ID=MMETSP0308-20130426/88696_1 /TAXON_ID=38269 /ORGANISM="Gloeochaete witrockiana, Strain SAG 46.84" /LENGTH=38 /DNA_ID= /DNA_START= /DNA_END= /DNA_ORIENTATION=
MPIGCETIPVDRVGNKGHGHGAADDTRPGDAVGREGHG